MNAEKLSKTANEVVVKFENVSIERDENLIWSQGSFEIEKGSVVAIIGSNGSGKTTLVELILDLLKPTGGKIAIDAEKIGYVPQHYHLSDDDAIRGIDLVQLGLNGNEYGFKTLLKKSEKSEKIEKALELVNAKDFAKSRFSNLSGGQQQRITIASAIVNTPQLLILDEPLSSLDLETAREIVGLIGKLNNSLDLTTLIVAHDLALLLPILTHAVYLVDGHPHLTKLDDKEHTDYSDLLEHLTTLKVGEHNV